MDHAKKIFLLPCGGCAGEIDVVAGQAGGQVACPGCGRQTDVPKYRDLSRLRIKPAASAGQAGSWGLPQAVALAGVACAALSWGTAAWIGSTPTSALDLDMIRANIEAGDDTALYNSLQHYAQSSVDRGAIQGEVALQRRARFAQRMSGALYGIGGAGAVAALVAGLASVAGAKRSS